ncbi:MAG: VWA domain-containing protein, partial [Candidatus Dormiibacterota bacterium]
VFATRLTRLTPELAERDPDLALRRAGAAAEDWAGGTRIGEAMAEFNDRWGRRGLARGAVVVVVSDGWEGANAARLGEEMGRLARMAHRVVWVNPRSARPTFRPETAGMAAALPHVDQLVSGHSLVALHRLLEAIRAGG